MPWLKLVLALLVAVGCPLKLHAEEASQFVAVKLPRGVQLEVPKGWWFIGEDFNRLIETSVEAAMDLAGEEYASTEEVNLIAANSMPRSTYAAVRIDSTMPPFFTPSDFDTLSEEDVRAY